MTRIRLAVEEDIPKLVEMGVGMLSGSSFATMTYAPEKTADFFRTCINGKALVVVTTDESGQITGCLCGDVVEPYYSTDRMGIEHFVYVRPEFRGGRSALMLIRCWIVWAKQEGAKQIRPGTAAVSEKADRLYLALGFKPAGSLYVMDGENNG